MKKLFVILTLGLFIFSGCDQADLLVADDPTVEQVSPVVDSTETEMVETEIPEAMTPTPSETSQTQPGTETTGAPREIEISIRNNKFNDEEWVIHEYGVVTWTNQDDVAHSLTIVKTSDSPDDLDDSGDDYDDDYAEESGEYSNFFEFTLSPGGSFTYTFEDDGRYEIHLDDQIMTSGVIHVSDSYDDGDHSDDYDDDRYDDEYDDDSDDDYDDDYDDDEDDDYEEEGTSFWMTARFSV